MSYEPYFMSINDIHSKSSKWKKKIITSNCLHYCPPSAGGWGIIRVALLVPESVLLFVSPAACGRHGAIAGRQLGFKDRLFLLHMKESHLVTGYHMDRIDSAVSEIIKYRKSKPKALTICATCIDDLLASDYEGLAKELQEKYKIPVRDCHMDPIAMDGKTPPPLTVQRMVYDYIDKADDRDRDNSINIIGNVAAIDEQSEFYKVMYEAGISKIRHVASCGTFEEFQKMGGARHNILMKTSGKLAVKDMEKRLGIPYVFAPVEYDAENIAKTYKKLEHTLELKLDTQKYFEQSLKTIGYYRKKLGPLSVAVGSSINASPFELACALTKYGFSVPYIFTNQVLDYEGDYIDWLKLNAPDIKVFTNAHPTMVDFLEEKLEVDIAIGFDAGYFCHGPKTVPLLLDSQPFGYKGISYLLEEMEKAIESEESHREKMYSHGLVI